MEMDNREIHYNLTHPQKRIWYIEKIYSGYPLNNIGGCLKINGVIDFKVLCKAINEVIKNNDGVRLRVIEKEGEPYQYVADYKEEKIDYYDFSKDKNAKTRHENWVNNMFRQPFNLENSSLYYFAMYKISEKKCGVLLKIHHLISDGWSIYYLIQKQICETYDRMLNTKDTTPSKVYSYIDYIDKENKYIESDKFRNNKEYWIDKLRGISDESLYKSSNSPKGKRLSFNIDSDRSKELKKYLKIMKYSLNELFTAILMIYLNKTMSNEDITIGIPVLNRTGVKDKNTIGMFISTMPLRLRFNTELTINELLDHIRLELKQCFRNQKYPYNLMINDLEIPKKGFDSLFKVSLNCYNVRKSEKIGEIKTELEEYYSGFQSYSLQIVIKEWADDDTINLNFDYRLDDYADKYISNMYRFFTVIIDQIIKDSKKQIKEIKLLASEDINYSIYTKNATKNYYPKEKTIHELFEEQVIKDPHRTALINGEKSLTYNELNRKSYEIAKFLRKRGIGAGTVVGLLGNHSFELISGILGVLKAGGAYLPIDSNYPVGRINYMLNDSSVSLLLTNIEIDNEINFDGEIVYLNDEKIYKETSENLNKASNTNDLAYIIYTSGSTGKPKGVMIEHRSLINYIWWAKKNYVKEDEIFAFYSSIAFDLTITSIFTPLISGSTIAIYHDDGTEFILDKILRQNIATVVKLTPSHLRLIKDFDNRNSLIKKLIVGGENLKTSLAKDIHESFGGNIEILNEYGPTEATVGCMIYKYRYGIDAGASVPIGKPNSNTQIYVLDKDLNVMPEEIEGEIYISGDCLSRGYLNNDKMTNERFIENPFIKEQKMYRTGDIAKYLEDGNIEYCGRKDNQVKIRGHRIELGEIEEWLLKNHRIKDVVVAIKEKSDEDKLICAYLIKKEDITENELNDWLSKHIPKYMMPSIFIFLDEFPLTSNGKIDVQTLLDIDFDDKEEFINYRNEIEKSLVEIMKEILMVDTISLNDNFYRLGGDSIKAIQISYKLNNKGYSIKLKDILSNDTIEEIAASIEISGIHREACQGLCEGYIKKTPIIEWFFSKNFNNMHHFNQSVLLKLNQNISTTIIRQGIERIIEHHDSLRLNYDKDKDTLFYNNEHLNKDFQSYFYDLSELTAEDQNARIKEIGYKIKSSFDIGEDLLLRTCVFKLGKEEQMLLITAHHLVVDGISWRIILEDFSDVLDQIANKKEAVLPQKTHPYSKWSENLLEYSKEILDEEKGIWEETEKNENSFPRDYDLGQDLIRNSKTLCKAVNKKLIDEFSRNINDIYNMEFHEGLIVALVLAINKFKNQMDIIIELENHGREDINKNLDISRTVGWFTSIYPAHFQINYKELGSNLKSLKNQLRNIPNKGFNYSVFKYLNKKLTDRNRKYIRFNYLGDFDNILNTQLFEVSNLSSGLDIGESNSLTSIFDINLMIINKELNISITYSKNKYKNDTIEKFIDVYVEQIEEILNHCSKKEDIEFTVSDFDTVDISQENLDSLFM